MAAMTVSLTCAPFALAVARFASARRPRPRSDPPPAARARGCMSALAEEKTLLTYQFFRLAYRPGFWRISQDFGIRVTYPVTWNLSRAPVTKINSHVAGAPVTRAPVTKSTTLPPLSRDPTTPRCLALDMQTAPRGRVIGPRGVVGWKAESCG